VNDKDIVTDDQGVRHTRECVERGWSVLDWEQDCLRDPEVQTGAHNVINGEVHGTVIQITGDHTGDLHL
jgi:hypothetical protein